MWSTTNWKILRDGNTKPTSRLRNLCVGREAAVKNRHGTTDWLKIGKGV